MISADILIDKLPPHEDRWITIKKDQVVNDIMDRILVAHKKYATYYNNIALYFDADTTEEICDNLYDFCKKNIKYKEEPQEDQTTSLPTGILVRGKGDCKAYASFCGGILDAIRRLTGKKIDWFYRFASYNFLSSTPHHVFVVVMDKGKELWLDPVPGADQNVPSWYLDKRIKSNDMALRENIAGPGDYSSHYNGFNEMTLYRGIGIVVSPNVDVDNLNFDGTHKYANVFGHHLGLSAYADFENDNGTNWQAVADDLNNKISQGPEPGHVVTADFVKWIFDNSVRFWNFYYPGGVSEGFDASNILPSNWPRLIKTDDGRLTFDHDVLLDDYRNAEIHILNAWVQSLVNQFDDVPYPLKPRDLKLFSQEYSGNPGNPNANLFSERRGAGLIKEIGKTLNKEINFLKDFTLKFGDSIPRNAFLGLIGINAFGWATKMKRHIDQPGEWDELSNIWTALGGNPDKLKNTIEDGAKKNAILGQLEVNGMLNGTIGVAPAAAAPAWLAAAAPIIAIVIKFLDKDGKATEIAGAFKQGIVDSGLFPDLKLQVGDTLDFLDPKTGMYSPVKFAIDPKDNENLGGGNNALPGSSNITTWLKQNPLPTAGIFFIGTMLLTHKKGQKPNYIISLLIAGVTYFVLSQSATPGPKLPPVLLPGSTTDKRHALLQWLATDSTDTADTISRIEELFAKTMSDTEINSVYDYVFNYFLKNIPVPQTSPLYAQIIAISNKYQIFT